MFKCFENGRDFGAFFLMLGCVWTKRCVGLILSTCTMAEPMSSKKKPNLTPEELRQCVAELLDRSIVVDGKRVPAHGALGIVAGNLKFPHAKQFLLKVMFLAVVARPRFDEQGNCTFDGNIGTWPFIEKVAAQHDSTNRPAGTLETKCVSVTKERYRDFIINKVLPAARAKWPRDDRSWDTIHIGLQHDNPASHFNGDDPIWQEAANGGRIKFHLREQPAQSPTCNILDLGLFRSWQSDYYKLKRARTIDGLIANVIKAWVDYDPKKLNRIFLTHQACMDEILKCNGDNTYQLPHLQKSIIEKSGNLPARLEASPEAIQNAKKVLDN